MFCVTECKLLAGVFALCLILSFQGCLAMEGQDVMEVDQVTGDLYHKPGTQVTPKTCHDNFHSKPPPHRLSRHAAANVLEAKDKCKTFKGVHHVLPVKNGICYSSNLYHMFENVRHYIFFHVLAHGQKFWKCSQIELGVVKELTVLDEECVFPYSNDNGHLYGVYPPDCGEGKMVADVQQSKKGPSQQKEMEEKEEKNFECNVRYRRDQQRSYITKITIGLHITRAECEFDQGGKEIDGSELTCGSWTCPYHPREGGKGFNMHCQNNGINERTGNCLWVKET